MVKPYHHGDLRNALIEAAQELLREEGAAGIEVSKVARRAGVSHNAPYRHFADKKELMATLAQLGFEKLNLQMKTAMEQAPPEPLEQIKSGLTAYVLFGIENPAYLREMFSGLTIDRTDYPELYTTSKLMFRVIAEIVEEGQARGEIQPGSSEDITVTFLSLIHGLTMLLIEGQIPGVKENPALIQVVTENCLRTTFNGVATRKAIS